MIVKIDSGVRAPRLDDLLDRQGLAEFLGVSDRTIDRWFLLKIGPPRVKIGAKIYYRASAVTAWLRDRETGGPVNK